MSAYFKKGAAVTDTPAPILPTTDISRWRVIALLAGLALFGNLLIIANPGFYSHDEWQKVDSLDSYNFSAYVLDYGRLRAGPQFGFPVRPLGFIQQGISALFMRDAPVIAHGIDVAIHIAVVILVWMVLTECNIDRRRSFLVAAVFAISPLTVLCTGWVGASFDRWYTLFCLMSTFGFIRVLKQGIHFRDAFLILVGSALAIVSKETSVMLPVLISGVWLLWKLMVDRNVTTSRLLFGLTLVTTPIIGYLIIRLPALRASFFGHASAGAYTPSLDNVFHNAALYFSQPFLFGTVDLDSSALLPAINWYWAFALHMVILVALMLRYGLTVAVFYLAAYFLFLIPVIPVGTHGAHYLYASAVPFSIAMIYAFTGYTATATGKYCLAALLCLIAATTVSRAIEVEWGVYARGMCQSRFLETLDAQLQSGAAEPSDTLDLYIKFGAAGYVGRSAIFGRPRYDGIRGPNIIIHDEQPSGSDRGALLMTPSCKVIRL
jgi:hypothetical protein